MTILWSKSTNPLCLTSQYSWILGAVRLLVFSNPFCMVSINFLYCRSLHPAAQIASGEMSATLSLAPNYDNRIDDLTQSSMSWDSMMSKWEGSVRNPFRSACKMAGGLRETASEALCHFPGQWWMVNLYLRIFSFSLNNRGFGILLRSLSPNSPFSGLWSVTTIRFGQPITNIQHFSNAHAIAAALPLIGAYLHLANIGRQPTGALSVIHMQYFCSSRKPIPSLLLSGVRQVTRFFSNVEIPFLTKSTMTFFECSNASLRLLSHTRCESHLTKSRNGSMTGPSEYAQATWLTSLNHDLTSVRVLGIGKPNIASSMDSEGVIPEGVFGGLQTALCLGKIGIFLCWARFHFLRNEGENWRCERRPLQC